LWTAPYGKDLLACFVDLEKKHTDWAPPYKLYRRYVIDGHLPLTISTANRKFVLESMVSNQNHSLSQVLVYS